MRSTAGRPADERSAGQDSLTYGDHMRDVPPERAVQDDLDAMDLLHRVGNYCIRPDMEMHEALEEILNTALALVGADKGDLQLLDRVTGSLKIFAQRGFGPAFLRHFETVQPGDNTACGRAVEFAERVMIEDVTKDEQHLDRSAREALLEEGVRAVQSTPLISSTGIVLGMISTHFERSHRPTERQLRFVDLLARLAADYLERKSGEEALRASETRLADQKVALELAMSGAPLPAILHLIARSAQNQLGENVRTVIYLVAPDGPHLRCAASAGMPPTFTTAVEHVTIHPEVFSSGQVSYGKTVIIEDVETDPRFRAHAPLATAHGVVSIWIQPLHAEAGKLLGLLVVHHGTRRLPSAAERDALRILSHTASLIIERDAQLEERRQAQAAIRLRTEQFEALLNEAPLGVFLVDANLTFQEANPTACETFGVRGLIGRNLEELIREVWPAELADELVNQIRKTLATGEPYVTPERATRRRGKDPIMYFEGRINRIPLAGGRFGIVCYFRDITAHVETRKRLETADRQKNEFLAMLAHELRNPLAPIRTVGDLLASTGGLDARRMGRITSILQRQAEHLTRLVDDLLDVSRITQGRIELRRQPVYLSQIVAQSVETVDALMREKCHRLTVTGAGEPLRVMGDPARLVQCLVNVLTNAAKYTAPEGDIRVEWRGDREAVILVTDNGPGIAPELLAHIFDLFVQSDRTLDRSQGGLGIGLSVVRRLVEMHGGRVSAMSPGPGHGSSFEIRLPLYLGMEEPETEEAPTDGRPQRILIVDDNADAANSLGMLLQLKGHQVESVYTSHQALERAQTLEPEVVLLDIGLPDIDGYEVARRLRATHSRRMRLIALTGYGQREDREQARSAGFDDHLVKPVDFGQLERAIASSAAPRAGG